MNLIHEELRHQHFGAGEVIEQTPTAISVKFSDEFGVRKFLYPSAFESFLDLSNPEAKEIISEEIRLMHEKTESERIHRKEAYDSQREEEQKVIAEQKKATAKKRAPSKASVAKAKKAALKSGGALPESAEA
ncbi:MAG: hypothetical protein LBU32_16365 [Clostridiales bacterium]|jgi:hypothetical protein|nr:hypothetical protein [Clostridiales bacterium]